MKQIQTSHIVPALCAVMLLGLSEYAGSFVSAIPFTPEQAEKVEIFEASEQAEVVQELAEAEESALLFDYAYCTDSWDSAPVALAEQYSEDEWDTIYFYKGSDELAELVDITELIDTIDVLSENFAVSVKD